MNRDVCEHFNPVNLPCDKCQGEPMTTLRTAAQQALEALEAFLSDELRPYEAAKTAAALRAALAEPVQEPVYWEVRCTAHPKWMRVDEQQFDEYVANGWEGQRLYAAPPQHKPLTEEEIDSIWDSEKAFADIYAIVRAIERAHGIGGNA